MRPLRLAWVLRGQLALGPAPSLPAHLGQLEAEGVRAVLSLCAAAEAPLVPGLAERFRWSRCILPDHRSGRLPTGEELAQAVAELEQLSTGGAVYLHCVAAVERSPLVAMAWLMQRRGLNRLQALAYLMEVNPGTNPLPGQLALLEQPPWAA